MQIVGYISRLKGFVFFVLTVIGFLSAGNSYAQKVPIPNPAWPLDSVVSRSVHQYTVDGDPIYTEASWFVWVVEGGHLYYDEAATMMAGTGIVDTVLGVGKNITQMYVKWDSFDQPLDTGYVYVYEISSNGCQRLDTDEGKYQGMRIRVSAPPKVRFIDDQTIACTNIDSALIVVEIDGMPPYDLKYSIDGVVSNWHIEESDLADLDGDSIVNNVGFWITGYSANTTDEVHQYRLLEASSGGVPGKVLPFDTHELIIHVRPPAPEILTMWTEVTTGTTKTYDLFNQGQNPAEWYWSFNDNTSALVDSFHSTAGPTWDISFKSNPGLYYLESWYRDDYGCYSFSDTLDVELFGQPTIAFADTSHNIINCSSVSLVPDETFEFAVEYYGARTFNFSYEVYDYNNVLVYSDSFEYLESRTNIITIPNKFINDALPEKDRPWTVKIKSASNEEIDVTVKILDSEIDGGRDERVIMIHPKPIILDDIDFAN